MDIVSYYKHQLKLNQFIDLDLKNKTLQFFKLIDENFKYDYIFKDNKMFIRLFK